MDQIKASMASLHLTDPERAANALPHLQTLAESLNGITNAIQKSA
jgi:hypothetical protein